ncbi:MAG: serine hydrolase, partial [Patescibacteria group bacterium]
MIMHFFYQLMLSTLLLQLFPVDGADIQRLATQTEMSSMPSSVYYAFSLPSVHLPESASVRPVKLKPSSLGVVTSAVSAIVVDRKSKQILFAKNMDAPRSIGSITKLMTAFVFLSTNPDLNTTASLETDDFRSGGVQHLLLNEQATVKDLLYASLISSDNSATASLVRLSRMTHAEFVKKMNEAAEKMGMQDTTFVDPTGLSPKNKSVVYDIVKMLDHVSQNEIIRDATEHDMFTIKGASGKSYVLKSTDQLLSSFINQSPYRVIAGKTGFLPEAGYCLGTVVSHEGASDVIV